MEGDPPWWGIFVISAGVTLVLGVVFVSVVGAVALGVTWVRSGLRRRSSSGRTN